jgi:hypothetical protein
MVGWEAERERFGLALLSEKLGRGMGGWKPAGVSGSGEGRERANAGIGSVGGVGRTVLKMESASVSMSGVAFSSGGGSESARSTCGPVGWLHGGNGSRERSGASPRNGGDDGVAEPMKREKNKSEVPELQWIGLPTVATMLVGRIVYSWVSALMAQYCDPRQGRSDARSPD